MPKLTYQPPSLFELIYPKFGRKTSQRPFRPQPCRRSGISGSESPLCHAEGPCLGVPCCVCFLTPIKNLSSQTDSVGCCLLSLRFFLSFNSLAGEKNLLKTPFPSAGTTLAGLQHGILLPQPSEYQDYSYVLVRVSIAVKRCHDHRNSFSFLFLFFKIFIYFIMYTIFCLYA